MQIQGFQKTTLLDYPGHLAATVFLGGCNFCCPFCHNKEFVLPPLESASYKPEEVLAHLKKRCHVLDGVCISGGEPTISSDLLPFIVKIRSLGLKIKLDTNGYRPDVLKMLCQKKLLDYVAMDIKGSPSTYEKITGFPSIDMSRIQSSIDCLMEQDIPFEFRTTAVKQLHTLEDFKQIGQWIRGAPIYFLQQYRDSEQVISPGFSPHTKEELESFQSLLQKTIPIVEIRGLGN
ncbi:anaerobic ribonucleoside-triphosphate reductase activating protein [Lachnospiraceae bacterium ZAX-1]